MRVALFWVLSMGIFLSACGAQPVRVTAEVENFQPPIVVSVAPGSVVQAQPSPTPVCTDGLLFIDDLTIPDGTLVAPGERLDKRWQVKNVGSCSWDTSYQIELIAGPAMDAPTEQALYPALSGTEVTIQMIFTAPQEVETYRSAWQAYDAHHQPFGDPFYIEIEVVIQATLEAE